MGEKTQKLSTDSEEILICKGGMETARQRRPGGKTQRHIYERNKKINVGKACLQEIKKKSNKLLGLN